MSKGLIDKILSNIFDAEWAGRYGEKLTERELKLVKLLGRKGNILRNVYIPKENGETSEIDVLFITQKGIFVFESKNYSGWIFGDEDGYYWTVTLPNGIKNKLYNPIKQNKTHMKWLGKFVGENIPLFSIIVFSERCELKKVKVLSDNVHVIKRDRTYNTVKNIWDVQPDILNKEQVKEITFKLRQLTNVDEAVKKAHVENIDNKYCKKSNIKEETGETLEVHQEISHYKICPRCGGKLLLRTAKKGANAGKKFYGCEKFPKCRYIESC